MLSLLKLPQPSVVLFNLLPQQSILCLLKKHAHTQKLLHQLIKFQWGNWQAGNMSGIFNLDRLNKGSGQNQRVTNTQRKWRSYNGGTTGARCRAAAVRAACSLLCPRVLPDALTMVPDTLSKTGQGPGQHLRRRQLASPVPCVYN